MIITVILLLSTVTSFVIQAKSTDGTTLAINTTDAQKQAIIKGIQDYLQGKTDTLPAHKENNVPINKSPMAAPLGLNEILSQINYTTSTNIPVESHHNIDWAIQYAFVGGSPYPAAWAIDGMVNTYNNLVSDSADEFVMHQNGNVDENCIQAFRSGSTVNFWIWTQFGASGYYPYIGAYQYPASDEFYLYVRPHLIDGAGHYDSVEYCIWDLTTNTATVITAPFRSGVTGTIKTVDVALEFKYPPSYPPVHWHHADQVHAYAVDGSMMNLQQNMHMYQLYTDTVQNAFYADFSGGSNTVGSIWLTRYDPRGSYPPHP